MYMRTTDDNRLLIGGEDEDFVDAAKEIPYSTTSPIS
jgi:hypothetical protein